MTETVLEQGVTDVSSDREDDGDTYPNLKTAKVVATDWELESEQEVVEEREWECCRNAVVREHVGEHTNLVVDWRRAPYEGPELLRDGGPVPPLLDGIENELAATECVLLPTVQFVVASLP